VEDVGKILPVLFRTQILRDSAPALQLIAPLWSRIAGKEIAGQSQPTAFEDGTLTLTAECPTWALQLGRMTDELCAQINCFLGYPVVKKVRVRCSSPLPRVHSA